MHAYYFIQEHALIHTIFSLERQNRHVNEMEVLKNCTMQQILACLYQAQETLKIHMDSIFDYSDDLFLKSPILLKFF